ncbi:MAG: NUDIX domain-containing protein [Patescibacteria group bacterium]|nr:NUDIX domain-containing protein [Patescibacteria group bacterium]
MADHLVDVVNLNDDIIGQDLKSNKIAKDFISRVVAILLLDENNNIILCRRSDKKINAAGKYDLAAFGNVEAGESYDNAAARELKEELGIECNLKLLDKFYQEVHNDDKTYKIFCGVFVGITDQELKLNHELVEVKKMTIIEVEKDLINNSSNYCPGFINDFNRVRNKLAVGN